MAIERAAERGERLTRQLLTFSRRQILRPEAVDLRRRAGEITDLLSRSLRDDISINVELAEDLWPILADPTELELALLNIGVNARDAMLQGGRFRLGARNLRSLGPEIPSQGLSGEFVELTLSDTGAGMTPEVLARAFEPYFTTKPVGLGSGLGLSQVYGFAQQSGGTATIASAPGKGTRITLYLPRARSAGAAAEPAPAPTGVSAPGLRILLVEDDAEVADATAELLAETGWRIEQVPNGEAAITLIERDQSFGLVLSDLVMPGEIGGLELARILRRRRPELPVVLATGYSGYGEQALADGFTLIEKPYRRDTLLAAIQAAVAHDNRAL